MNIVCFGAHPDDGELYAGGTLIKLSRAGHRVLLVSMTNGDIGHHELSGGALALRRREEARRSAALGGLHELVLDHHDGELMPTMELRREVVKIIREWESDIVLTHRPYDYHPDHRYTAMTVQDAAYMVMVPNFCPHIPALKKNPVFLYMMDDFTRPAPFRVDVAVDVGDVMDVKWAMIDAMDSQFYEWLPWIMKAPTMPPADAEGRRVWLKENWDPYFRSRADKSHEALVARYGAVHAAGVTHAEYFELCEYGECPDPEALLAMFP
jgi:LmbE family N-acetylglucosaminyl deacetylase